MTNSGQNEKPKSQRDKFIDKARELGADEDEAAFEKKLRRIARQVPRRERGQAD